MFYRRSAGSLIVALTLWFAAPAHAEFFTITNLVTDDQSVNPAQITDPNLKNPWGVSRSGSSPFWVSNNGTGTSTLYRVDPTTNATVKQGLTVSIPGDGSVTGQVFSGGGGFNNDTFLFVSEDGTISGWRGALGSTAETLALPSGSATYKGVALATVGTDKYLYSANFQAGTIDVLKGSAAAPNLTGSFTDPNIPSGYAPFNIQNLNGTLYVTYALQDATGHDDVAGAGHGFVDAFDTQGNFLGRIATQGALNSPWGLAIAPSSFGSLAGDLLVGNFGDGKINVYDLSTKSFVGQLLDKNGNPLSISGLWSLTLGNGGLGGSAQKLYFTAGPNDESNGLFGVIQGVPEPGSLMLALLGATSLACFRRRRAAGRTEAVT